MAQTGYGNPGNSKKAQKNKKQRNGAVSRKNGPKICKKQIKNPKKKVAVKNGKKKPSGSRKRATPASRQQMTDGDLLFWMNYMLLDDSKSYRTQKKAWEVENLGSKPVLVDKRRDKPECLTRDYCGLGAPLRSNHGANSARGSKLPFYMNLEERMDSVILGAPLRHREEPMLLEIERDCRLKDYIASNINENFICPISYGHMSEPTVIDCGHSFDRASLEKSELAMGKTCPVCKRSYLQRPTVVYAFKKAICDEVRGLVQAYKSKTEHK